MRPEDFHDHGREPERPDCEVLVVGAGVTGLAAALDLAQRGIGVRLVDRSPEPLAGSRAWSLPRRSLEILADLGVLDEVLARAQRSAAHRIQVRDKVLADLAERRGRSVPTTAGQRFAGSVALSQEHLEEVLRVRLADLGVRVEFGHTLRRLDQDADGVTTGLTDEKGGEHQLRSAYVIGADGEQSTVRHLLRLAFAPTSTASATSITTSMTTAGSTSTGRSVTTAGSRSPAASSPTVRLVGGDVAVEGLPRADRTYRWCGPDHDITLAPLPHSSPGGAPLWAVRIVADVAALGTTPPSRGVLETVFHRFTGWTQVRYADATCLFAYDLTPGVVDRMRDGRVFVAGDAAHAHTLPAPHASAGLAAGLRDATNLSWKLAAVLRGAGEDLLDSYEAERLPAALRTNQLSADPVRELLGDVTGWPAALLGARRSPRRSARRGASRSPRRGAGGMLRSLPPPAARLVLRRRAARDARRRDPDLHYRDSRLSQELGGRRLFLHAGDPVPDVRLWSPDRAADVRLSDVRLSDARAQSQPQVTLWTVLGLGSVTTEVVRAALHRFGPAVRGEVIGGGLGTARGVTLLDRYGEARRLLGRQGGSVLVVRPDGHLGLRCGLNPDILLAYLDDLVGSPAEVTG